MNHSRVNCNSFLVNDSIYVFGGCTTEELAEGTIRGEQFILRENKWRPV
eukprot:CAMPEP_0202957398 /NCGR_PEP_ID=MMETSP1396-20130829/1798_1 /ASSEMBLY_ACC=CAM_ASM_000872 /TAXON_ID= /ORGANISM="Pseudokeronopsis sp., Strain Brazil" /LENGTH=48 /DNA_ID= /DNA_START= /DNA_END= /DNA_ORIENTATION=